MLELTDIHVAYRVLNEKGFQQTLAALAGAQLSDSPDDIKRTITATSWGAKLHRIFSSRRTLPRLTRLEYM